VKRRGLHIRFSYPVIQRSRYPLQLSVRHIPSFLPPLLFINSLGPKVHCSIGPIMKLSTCMPFAAFLMLTVAERVLRMSGLFHFLWTWPVTLLIYLGYVTTSIHVRLTNGFSQQTFQSMYALASMRRRHQFLLPFPVLSAVVIPCLRPIPAAPASPSPLAFLHLQMCLPFLPLPR